MSGEVLSALLPVLDNLERAVAAAQQAGEKGPLVEGVAMVQNQFLELFKRFGVTRIDAQDNILIAEDLTHRIRKYVVAEKKLVDVAGTGKKGAGGLGGPPAVAEIAAPHGLFFHRPTGVIYIGDTLNHRVVKIEP